MTPFTLLKTAAACVVGFIVIVPILLVFWIVVLLDPSFGKEYGVNNLHYPSKYEYIGSLPK